MCVYLVYVEINIAKDGGTESKFNKASKAPQATNLLYVEVFEHGKKEHL